MGGLPSQHMSRLGTVQACYGYTATRRMASVRPYAPPAVRLPTQLRRTRRGRGLLAIRP